MYLTVFFHLCSTTKPLFSLKTIFLGFSKCLKVRVILNPRFLFGSNRKVRSCHFPDLGPPSFRNFIFRLCISMQILEQCSTKVKKVKTSKMFFVFCFSILKDKTKQKRSDQMLSFLAFFFLQSGIGRSFENRSFKNSSWRCEVLGDERTN